jgi:lipopolysaccharide assembly outer membrane protein LptD (OstA)
MDPRRIRMTRVAVPALALALAASTQSIAQQAGPTAQMTLRGGIAVPSNCTIAFTDAGPGEGGRVKLSGYVDIQCGDFRVQADTVTYDSKTKAGTAEGSVVLDWGPNRITGSRLDFDLALQTGTMTDATGWIEPEAILIAEKIQKLDEDHIIIEKGTFTSCTQPIPYWSFKVGHGVFHLNHYAHLRHVRMNIGQVPFLYLPYLLWPIKGDRATGLLFPQWGTSHKYGFYVGTAFFWALSRNADITTYGDWYSSGGPAAGVEANWLPTERGKVRLTGYYLQDNKRDERRYMGRLQFEQPFGNGWKLGADINQISDFAYYQDFERNLTTASSSLVQSTMGIVNNGEDASLNAKASRRQQFFFTEESVPSGGSLEEISRTLSSEQVQDTIPEIELRGRSRRLPGSPLYFSYETSADWFRKSVTSFYPNGQTQNRATASWGRLDFEPRFSLPLRPLSWLSIEGTAVLRETYYTSMDTDVFTRTFGTDPLTGRTTEATESFSVSADAINRHFYQIAAEVIGPSFYRVYPSSSEFSTTFKHVIEPHLTYQFVPTVDEQSRVPIFDDRDPVTGDQNLVTFSIVNRLFAKRPTQKGAPRTGTKPDGSATGGTLPWSSFPAPVETPPPPPPVAVTPESEETEGGMSTEEPDGGLFPESQEPGAALSSSAHPPAAPAAPSAADLASRGPSASGASSASAPAGAPGEPAATAAPLQQDPVEILSVELSQSYSFRAPLSTEYQSTLACTDGTAPPCPAGVDLVPRLEPDGTRSYGPLSLAAHFNPLITFSIDVRADYDLVNSSLSSSAISGWYRWKTGYVNSTWFRQTPVNTFDADESQLRVGLGSLFFNRKLTLDGELGYDLHRSDSLDRRGRIGYYTQCCGFIVEYLERDFDVNARREVHFVIDLKGIGKFLDPNLSLGTK